MALTLVHTTNTNKQMTLEGLHTLKFVFCETKRKRKQKQNKVFKVFFFFKSYSRSYYRYKNNIIKVNILYDLEPLKICFVSFRKIQ